jgi:hypothetical protein
MRIRILIVALIMFPGLSSTSQNVAQAAPKTTSIKIKLPSGVTTTAKGTKVQIFKTLEKEAKKLDGLEDKLDSYTDCGSLTCIKLKKEIKDSEKKIEVITKSLYSKSADASMLSPLNTTELKFFASLVRQDIQDIEIDLDEIEQGKNRDINEYLASFENSYLSKVGWDKAQFIQAIKDDLNYNLRSLNKLLAGFEWLIINKNPDGITEISIGRGMTMQGRIATQEQIQLNSANANK